MASFSPPATGGTSRGWGSKSSIRGPGEPAKAGEGLNGPCLLLIDELVAYARKIYGVEGLPCGTFDAVQTFIQELTEAVRASRDSVLVATIPESDIEIGGDAGRETLTRVEHTFGRMEAIWKPVGAEEGFEVVRHRLFLPIDDEPARDGAARGPGRLPGVHPCEE